MTREGFYLIAESIAEQISSHELYNRNWQFAIYKSLISGNTNDAKPVEWTKYNQWNIDHNYRASKANAKINGTQLINIEVSRLDADNINIEATFMNRGIEILDTCLYSRNGFLNELWETRNPSDKTVLLSAFERDELFDALFLNPIEIESETITTLNSSITIDLKTSSIEAETSINENIQVSDQTVNAKFNALKSLLDSYRPVYHQLKDDKEKSFISTIFGAAIFYLPSSVEHFSGYISLEAIRTHLNGGRKVKDHIYPRKLAAKELLTSDFTLDELIEKYHQSLAQYMYLTATENSLLVNYFEDHDTHDDAIKALQIDKFPETENDKFKSHKELTRFLKYLSDQSVEITQRNATQLLASFRNQ